MTTVNWESIVAWLLPMVLGIGGGLVLLLFRGAGQGAGRGGKVPAPLPPRPSVPDVETPSVNANVADDYAAGRQDVTRDRQKLIDEVNGRHK